MYKNQQHWSSSEVIFVSNKYVFTVLTFLNYFSVKFLLLLPTFVNIQCVCALATVKFFFISQVAVL